MPVTAFTWKAPTGKSWRIYVFNKFLPPGRLGRPAKRIPSIRVLAKAFIEIALEPYAKRMGDKLGKIDPRRLHRQ